MCLWDILLEQRGTEYWIRPATRSTHIEMLYFMKQCFPFLWWIKLQTHLHIISTVFDHSDPTIDNTVPILSSNHQSAQCNPVPNSESVQCDSGNAGDTIPSLLSDQCTNTIYHPQEHISPIRRSTRAHKVPTYLNDYSYTTHQPTSTQPTTSHYSLHVSFSNHHHIAFKSLYLNSQYFVLSVSHDYKPSLYDKAIIDPAWQTTKTQELSALYDNNTWDLIPLPPSNKAIRYRWVYKIKHKTDGSIERSKARLVVKRYT